MTPVKKRGAVFWLDVRVNGKRHRVSLGTDNYYHALDKARAIERDLGKKAKFGPAVSFEEFKKKYLAWAWASKPASADREQQRIAKVAAFLAGQGIERLSEITPYHLEHLKGKLRADGLEKSTINRYLQLMRGMFYRAIEWGDYADQNPLRKVKFYREQSDIRPLTADQVTKVIEAAQTIALKPKSPLQRAFPDLIALALNTGLRKAEALNLKWKDVRASGTELSVVGKGDKRRTVPLNASARAVISRQPHGSEYIFNVPNRNQAGIFRRTTETISKRAGVHFNFHATRHTFATRLLAAGVDIVTISSILGHGRSMTTLLYSHTDPARKRQAVELIDGGVVSTDRTHGTDTSNGKDKAPPGK